MGSPFGMDGGFGQGAMVQELTQLMMVLEQMLGGGQMGGPGGGFGGDPGGFGDPSGLGGPFGGSPLGAMGGPNGWANQGAFDGGANAFAAAGGPGAFAQASAGPNGAFAVAGAGGPECWNDPCGGGAWGQRSETWGAGQNVSVQGDPHDYQNGQKIGDWTDTGATEKVYLNGNSEVDVRANAPGSTAQSVRAGYNLGGIDPNADVMEMVNGKMTDVGKAGQFGLTGGRNAGINVAGGQTITLPNGEKVSFDGQNVTMQT
jgi:hypothetical protein